MSDGRVVIASTNLDPKLVNQVALTIFAMWVDFALGRKPLGGRRLVYPTGRYAASLQFQQTGASQVAIFPDQTTAPEAEYIEHGHGRVDLKQILAAGVYPMHGKQVRYQGKITRSYQTGPTNLSLRHGLRRIGTGPENMSASTGRRRMKGGETMWAQVKSRSATGFASIGPNTAIDHPESWIIPPMRAYSPAAILQRQADDMIRKLGG